GEGIVFRRLDNARPHDAAHQFSFGGYELFAERFSVGVDIRPTPEFRALNAHLSKTIAHPHFSLASDRESERIRVVTIAHFFVETFTRLFAKVRGHHGVFRFFARAFRHLRAIANFFCDREVDAREFTATREVTHHFVLFPDRSGTITRDETS